jgi:hypothetical protein
MRALHFIQPRWAGKTLGFRTRNKSGLARRKTEDPERSFFLPGVARGSNAAAAHPEAAF